MFITEMAKKVIRECSHDDSTFQRMLRIIEETEEDDIDSKKHLLLECCRDNKSLNLLLDTLGDLKQPDSTGAKKSGIKPETGDTSQPDSMKLPKVGKIGAVRENLLNLLDVIETAECDLDTQKSEIESEYEDIKEQQSQIEESRQILAKQEDEVKKEREKLKEETEIIERKEEEILELSADIEKKETELKEAEDKAGKKLEEIRTREENLEARESELDKKIKVQDSVSRIQSRLFDENPGEDIFDEILEELLKLTGSSFGFICGTVSDSQTPELVELAIIDLKHHKKKTGRGSAGFEVIIEENGLESTLARILEDENTVITGGLQDEDDRAAEDEAPSSSNFIGIPLKTADGMKGIIGLGSNAEGYDEETAGDIELICSSCGFLMATIRENERRRSEKDTAEEDTAEEVAEIEDEVTGKATEEVVSEAEPEETEETNQPVDEVEEDVVSRDIEEPEPDRIKRMLVIDDSQSVRSMLSVAINVCGSEVFTAGTSEVGLRKAREFSPDLITLDLTLQGSHGFDALESLRSDPALEGIPVIMHSIKPAEETVSVLGALDFIRKPVKQNKLLEVLKRSLPLKDNRILVVTDDSVAEDQCRKFLGKEKVTLSFASEEEAAIETLEEIEAELIILDLLMRNMAGSETLRRLRCDKRYLHLPVVLLGAGGLTTRERERLQEDTLHVLYPGKDLNTQLPMLIRDMLEHLVLGKG